MTHSKKDRDQLCFIVDERSNEIRNLKQKNEQLEQMIRNGKILITKYISYSYSLNRNLVSLQNDFQIPYPTMLIFSFSSDQ